KEEARKAAARRAEAERQAKQRMREALDTIVSEKTFGWLAAQKELLPQQRGLLERGLQFYQELAREAARDEQGRGWLAPARFRGRLLANSPGPKRGSGAAVSPGDGVVQRPGGRLPCRRRPPRETRAQPQQPGESAQPTRPP